MSLEAALFAILSQANTTAASRVYPQRLPDRATLPAMTYAMVSNGRYPTRGDGGTADIPGTATAYAQDGGNNLRRYRYQVDCWGTTYEAARLLSEAIENYLDGFSGTAADERLHYIFIDGVRDDYETGTEQVRRIVDVIIWHNKEIV
jgi:hypothetical protein